MAGETPGAHNACSNRRPLRWQDDRSTNKIYASGSTSALGAGRTVSDSVLKPGDQPAAVPTPRLKTDDKSADKYYANGGSDRVRGPQQAAAEKAARRGLAVPAAAPVLGVAGRRPAVTTLSVRTKEDVRTVLDALVPRLQSGETGLVVTVAAGASNLLHRTRSALDLLVTREVITEDQYREVRLSYEPAAAEKVALAAAVGVPATTATVRTEDNEDVADPLAFLSGDTPDPDDQVVDTSPVVPTEVDTTTDVVTSVPESAAEDDDDNDFGKTFLTPEPTAAAPEVPTGAPADAVPAPKRGGRRRGR